LAQGDIANVMLPFWISGAGIVAAILGYFAVGTQNGATQQQLMFALHKGTIVSSAFTLGFSALIVAFVYDNSEEGWKLFGCIAIGLTAGILIGQVTEYFTSYSFWPVRSITEAGITGPATVIIQGLGIGMISTVFPVVILVATILACDALSGEYGIAMAAVGMLSTLGVTLATDAYGPVADNAGALNRIGPADCANTALLLISNHLNSLVGFLQEALPRCPIWTKPCARRPTPWMPLAIPRPQPARDLPLDRPS
jgi:K(+)-stimulated pyrophosphate-energized sodium pump